MKSRLLKDASKWGFRLYIVWSICADIALISGIIYLVFF